MTKTQLFAKLTLNLLKGEAGDLSQDDIKCALFTSAASINASLNEDISELSGEASGDGYTAGGESVDNLSLTLSGKQATLSGDPVLWAGATLTFRYAVLYNATTGKLISYADLGRDYTVVGGRIEITPTDEILFMFVVD